MLICLLFSFFCLVSWFTCFCCTFSAVSRSTITIFPSAFRSDVLSALFGCTAVVWYCLMISVNLKIFRTKKYLFEESSALFFFFDCLDAFLLFFLLILCTSPSSPISTTSISLPRSSINFDGDSLTTSTWKFWNLMEF